MEVLLTGNTGYFNKESLQTIFPKDTVVVCSESHEDDKQDNVRWFKKDVMGDEFQRIFVTYGFDTVMYFSHFLTRDGKGVGEIEQLRRVLSMSQKSKIKRFVYVTSNEALLDTENSSSIIYQSVETICLYYARSYQIEVKVLCVPHLICGYYRDDFWCRIFDQLERGQKVEVKSLGTEVAAFLSVPDLSTFLYRLFESWDEYNRLLEDPLYETIFLHSGARTTYNEVAECIRQYYPQADIRFIKSGIKGQKIYGEDKARYVYGWFAKEDACADFGRYIKEYRDNFYQKPSLRERLRQKLRLNSRFMMIIELILGAALVEGYNRYSSGSVQFRMIDTRLLFVVLMASIYGTNVGALAAFIEIASLIWAYYRQGTNITLLFYDPGNWVPFILLLVAGAICGYVKQKKDEDINFIKEENRVVHSENVFISQLYQEAMEYKNQYKQDLIGSRDGFGRIFDVVKRLSTTVPEEIFAESIPVMEDVLGNRSIAIYTINDKNARFARLSVSSEQLNQRLKKSISLDDYRQVIDTVIEKEIWFNSGVAEGYPTYVTGIKSDGILTVLIMIYNVEFIQMGTYYTNLIRILSGLMENFILKAWEYQKAVANQTFMEGTAITRTEYFRQQLDIQKEMAGNKLTSFRLLRIIRDDRSLAQMDDLLHTKIRNNDIIGIGNDGNIYLLAAQVDESSEGIVLKRFRDMGLTCDIVEDIA